MSRRNTNLQHLGVDETETILQELDNYNVKELESINKELNNKMIDKMLGVQKKKRIGKQKADKIYERFMDYEQKKKRNKLNRKMMNMDKENSRIRRASSKNRIPSSMTSGQNTKFLDRVDHQIQSRQKRMSDLQMQNLVQKEREIQKECTFQPEIGRDCVYKQTIGNRRIEDLYEWQKQKDQRILKSMMHEKEVEKAKGYSFQPSISKNSRKMASQRNSGIKDRSVHERLYHSKERKSNRIPTTGKKRNSKIKSNRKRIQSQKKNSDIGGISLSFKKGQEAEMKKTKAQKQYTEAHFMVEYSEEEEETQEIYFEESENVFSSSQEISVTFKSSKFSSYQESPQNESKLSSHMRMQPKRRQDGLYKRKDVMEKFSSVTSTKFLRDFEVLQKEKLSRKKENALKAASRNASQSRLGIRKNQVKKGRKLANQQLDSILDNLLQANDPSESKEFEEQLFNKIKKNFIGSDSESEQDHQSSVISGLKSSMMSSKMSRQRLPKAPSSRNVSRSRLQKAKPKKRVSKKMSIKERIKNSTRKMGVVKRSTSKRNNSRTNSVISNRNQSINKGNKRSQLAKNSSQSRLNKSRASLNKSKCSLNTTFDNTRISKKCRRNASKERLNKTKGILSKVNSKSRLKNVSNNLKNNEDRIMLLNQSLEDISYLHEQESPLVKMADNLNSLKHPEEFLPSTSQFGVKKKTINKRKRKPKRHHRQSFSEESEESPETNYLMINGTKIYYDREAIGGIENSSAAGLRKSSIDTKIEHLRNNRGTQRQDLHTLAQYIHRTSQGVILKPISEEKDSEISVHFAKCSIRDLKGNIHRTICSKMETQVLVDAQNNPNLLLSMLRNQTNQIKSYLSVFLVKAEFMLNFVEQLITRYTEEANTVREQYMLMKISLVQTMQAQNCQMAPSSPKRERSEKGLGDLSSFNITLENYKSIDSPLKKGKDEAFELEFDADKVHAKYENHEFTAAYIEIFLDKFKDKIDDRIFNFEKLHDLLPNIEQTVDKLRRVFQLIISVGKDLTTQFSSTFREIWNGTHTELGMAPANESSPEKQKFESLDEEYQQSLAVLEYKIVYLVQDWFNKFESSIINPFEMFILYTNTSVKVEIEDETTLSEDLCHLNDTIRQVYIGEEDYLIKGDFIEYLDKEIDSEGKCRFEMMNLLAEDYQKYFQKEFSKDLYSEESGDTNFNIYMKQFDLNYKTHSFFTPEYISKIDYQKTGLSTVSKCVLILDIFGNLILLDHEYNLNNHKYSFDELIHFFIPSRKVTLSCKQEGKVTNFSMTFTKFQDSNSYSTINFQCREDSARVASFIKAFSLVKKQRIDISTVSENSFYTQIEQLNTKLKQY